MKYVKKFFHIAVLSVVLTACSSTPSGIATDVERSYNLAATFWQGYLGLDNCASPEGAAVAPACVDSNLVATVVPKRDAAVDAMWTYVAAVKHDDYFCTGVSVSQMNSCLENAQAPALSSEQMDHLKAVANAAIQLFHSIVSQLPQAS